MWELVLFYVSVSMAGSGIETSRTPMQTDGLYASYGACRTMGQTWVRSSRERKRGVYRSFDCLKVRR
jgi:hypothetical protein